MHLPTPICDIIDNKDGVSWSMLDWEISSNEIGDVKVSLIFRSEATEKDRKEDKSDCQDKNWSLKNEGTETYSSPKPNQSKKSNTKATKGLSHSKSFSFNRSVNPENPVTRSNSTKSKRTPFRKLKKNEKLYNQGKLKFSLSIDNLTDLPDLSEDEFSLPLRKIINKERSSSMSNLCEDSPEEAQNHDKSKEAKADEESISMDQQHVKLDKVVSPNTKIHITANKEPKPTLSLNVFGAKKEEARENVSLPTKDTKKNVTLGSESKDKKSKVSWFSNMSIQRKSKLAVSILNC